MIKAARTAPQVLSMYWDGYLPINPEVIAEQEGVRVVRDNSLQSLPYGPLSGLIGYERGIPTIVVNPFEHMHRNRFTIAHELGHYFLGHLQPGSDNQLFRDTVDSMSGRNYSPVERAANNFAAELLMPAEVVDFLFWQKGVQSVEELADYFFVSPIAMSYRLSNLGMTPGFGW